MADADYTAPTSMKLCNSPLDAGWSPLQSLVITIFSMQEQEVEQ